MRISSQDDLAIGAKGHTSHLASAVNQFAAVIPFGKRRASGKLSRGRIPDPNSPITVRREDRPAIAAKGRAFY
jgi:hypothetical protein